MSVDILKSVVNGVGIEYFTYGTGDRPLVVLPGLSIKSITLYKDAVAETLGLFGKDFKVYVFDRREDLPEVYTIEMMAQDYINAFKDIGLKDVSLYGISQGGMIALSIAVQSPDLVSAVVVGSSAARISTVTAETIDEWNRLAALEDEEALVLSFGNKVYSKAFFKQYKDAIVAANRGITAEEFARLVRLTGKMNSFDVFDSLSEIKCPVLVLAGRDDEIIPVGEAIDMSSKLGCDLHIFSGYGHAVYDENPEFKESALRFFTKVTK